MMRRFHEITGLPSIFFRKVGRAEAKELDGLPSWADFDDYRYSQRVAVLLRWFILAAFLSLINYRIDVAGGTLLALNGMGIAAAVANVYVQWRIWRGQPVTRSYVLALSVMDLAVITTGIAITTRFSNTFFVLYYPALLGLALVFPSRRLSFTVVTLVAIAYTGLSLTLEPKMSFAAGHEKVLILRIVAMFAVVAAGNLMGRIERTRRREAVQAERAQAQRNLELQRKAREAELAAQKVRDRIAREIHDGIAQSIYALSLNIETGAEMAAREAGPLKDHLQKLVPLAKKTLLETRHYIYDLKPFLSGERDLAAMAESQVRDFHTLTDTPVELNMDGELRELSVQVAAGLLRILQEALANILKHANASGVDVSLTVDHDLVSLTVQDDDVGFDPERGNSGYGLDNMRERATEMGGTFQISSAPGRGACIIVTVPPQEVENGTHQTDDRG